jgi:hypothetical protein
MGQNPSCEAYSNSANQETPHHLWNPKIHYCHELLEYSNMYIGNNEW